MTWERLNILVFRLAVFAAATATAAAMAAQSAVFSVETKSSDGRTSVETVAVAVGNGRAKFVWPRGKIPADTTSVKITPSFAMARVGDAGYWVFPDNTMGRFKLSNGRYHLRNNVFMPIAGMKTPQCAFVSIVSGMPHSVSCLVEAKEGVYSESLLFDRYMDDVYEDIAIEYVFLEGDDADYSGMARAYRKYQLERGACRPIRDRLKEQPLLEYAVRNIQVEVAL